MKRIFNKAITLFKGIAELLLHGKYPDRLIAWAMIVVICVTAGNLIYNAVSPNAMKNIAASEFITQLEAGNIEKMSISDADGSVTGKFKETTDDGVNAFETIVPSNSEILTAKYLDSTDVEYSFTKPSVLVSFIMNLLTIVFQIGLLLFAMMWLIKATGTLNDILPISKEGKFKVESKVPEVTFDDVWGVPEAKEEIEEIVAFLKDPDVYEAAGAGFPHGILLAGPSGTGKTLLAKALAGEAGVPFIAASGSDFVELYVGMGAKRVRELFEKAREVAPCILFIDEIDAVGGMRDSSGVGSHDEKIQTLNALLSEMDGFKSTHKVIVIAATNRLDSLDTALIRPGRFDRIITVDVPAKEGRKEILQHYAQDHPFADVIDFDTLAAHTYGFSGAQLENAVSQAATLAARRAIADGSNKPLITMEDLEEGIARTMLGPAMKSRKLTDREKEHVAYHEAGHAVVQYILPECDLVQKISIVSRNMPGGGAATGYVQTYSEDDKHVVTSEQIRSELAALLAGRAAEKMFCDIESAGAYDDLKKASNIAYNMVDKFAFSRIGSETNNSLRVEIPVGMGKPAKASQKRLEHIDMLVDAALSSEMATAERILSSHKTHVENIVAELLANETIDSTKIDEIMQKSDLQAAKKAAE